MGEELVNCSILPDKIGAGLTFSRPVTLTAYPAQEWTLSVLLRGPDVINLTATAIGNQHQLTASAASTANWTPGLYTYAARVTNGTDVFEVETGQLTVAPDIASVGEGHDGRTHSQRTLEAIEAVIEKRASLDQERYRINNRELYRTPIADLLKLRDLYRAEVRREQLAARGKNPFGAAVRVRLR